MTIEFMEVTGDSDKSSFTVVGDKILVKMFWEKTRDVTLEKVSTILSRNFGINESENRVILGYIKS